MTFQKDTNATNAIAASPVETADAHLKSHPICADAINPEKCEAFVERLEEASTNIDAPRQ